MKVSILYRTFDGENNATHRPTWYSKEACLKSMLTSCELLSRETTVSFTLLFDGHIDVRSEWGKTVRKMIEPRGSIIEAPHKGNAILTLECVQRASNELEDSVVVIAEDDYLWLPPAVAGLYHALTQLPAHYATPYDHPVRYQPDYPLGVDYPHWYNTIHITTERHWRTQESTCMTFASTAKILREDMRYFEKYQNNGKGKPEDRELFREMQGLGNYVSENPRILVGPIPSLATHLHLPWLAPVIDWEEEAKKV